MQSTADDTLTVVELVRTLVAAARRGLCALLGVWLFAASLTGI